MSESQSPCVDAEALKALIAKWREASQYEFDELGNTQFASALDQCADALEALLSAGPSSAGPEQKFVYVVEQGCYSSRTIVGVYATPEAAMEAHPLPERPLRNVGATHEREGGWRPCSYAEPGQEWSNGLDWDDGKDITRYQLESLPVAPVLQPETDR